MFEFWLWGTECCDRVSKVKICVCSLAPLSPPQVKNLKRSTSTFLLVLAASTDNLRCIDSGKSTVNLIVGSLGLVC